MPDIRNIHLLENIIGKTIPKIEDSAMNHHGYVMNDKKEVISLGIQNCQIKNLDIIINDLESFTKLEELNLWGNSIEDIHSISKLKNIIRLNIGTNRIKDLSPLKNLKNIHWLSINSNPIQDIQPLGKLHKLEYLLLINNNISDISPIKSLVKLLWFNAERNKITEIKSIEKLTKIQTLSLSNNLITDISVLSNLPNISYLQLDNNNISNITPLLQLRNLKDLNLNGNPIKDPPPEITNQGIDAIINWFDANKKLLKEIKVLLIGDHTAGKTSLSKRLKNDSYTSGQNQTDGIVIETFHFSEMNTFKEQKELHGTTAYFWDFGGQEIFNNTHQFFMTNRSVYILVLEARSDRDADQQVRLWMQRIMANCGKSPVIVVVNKIELNRGFSFDTNTLEKEFPQIKAYIKVSCATGENIDALKAALEQWIPKAEFFETEIDERWIAVKNTLQEKTGKQHKLHHEEFVSVCEKNGLLEKNEQEQAIHFLSDLGIALHFDELELAEYYVLDPYWVTTGVYRVITSGIAASLNGEINKNDLATIINEEQKEKVTEKHLPIHIAYSPAECIYLANIMEHFQLCYFFDGDKILIPDLLDKNTPFDKIQPFLDSKEKLGFTYAYVYLPTYIIPRLIVALKDEIKIKWRTGCILKYKGNNNTEALIIANTSKNKIEITVYGDAVHNYEFLAIIRHHVDRINSKYNLTPKLQVPLPGIDQAEDYDNLIAMLKEGDSKLSMYVDSIKYTFTIDKLISGVYNKEDNERIVERLTIKRVTIFLASSYELAEERKQLEIFIGRENKHQFGKNIFIELVIWEDLGSAMSPTRSQDEYNKEIKKCDIFIMLFFTKVGIYTREEFEIAFQQFKDINKPEIYTFSKDLVGDLSKLNRSDINSRYDFEDRLKELNHFKSTYSNTDNLLLQIKIEIDRIIQKLNSDKQMSILVP